MHCRHQAKRLEKDAKENSTNGHLTMVKCTLYTHFCYGQFQWWLTSEFWDVLVLSLRKTECFSYAPSTPLYFDSNYKTPHKKLKFSDDFIDTIASGHCYHGQNNDLIWSMNCLRIWPWSRELTLIHQQIYSYTMNSINNNVSNAIK